MKVPVQALLLHTALLFLYSSAAAQDTIDSTKTETAPLKKESYFKFGGNYLSNEVYSGRKDSSVVPYVRSAFGYYHKSGFYINAEASFLVSPDDTKRLDLAALEAGYTCKISEKLEAEIIASKFLYADASYAVTSELKGITGIGLGYDAGPVSINGGVELLFSGNMDINTNLKLSHYFEKGTDKKKWSLSPAVELNAGTQYYDQAYFENRKFTFATTSGSSGKGSSGKGHSGGKGSGTTTVKTLVFYNTNKFSILDYEFSAPVAYETRRWGCYASPTLAVPVNPANYAVDGVLQKEALSNSFFIEIGAFVKLNARHKKV
jgi:hypothetical protein